ncbi:MAG: hypothetical protein LBK41_00530 [Clostridiales bacterium]|nr:hypothetical protein [Clostridiales bacterium]
MSTTVSRYSTNKLSSSSRSSRLPRASSRRPSVMSAQVSRAYSSTAHFRFLRWSPVGSGTPKRV